MRATIYVTQPGRQAVHDAVKDALCANFGGYSDYAGDGGWVDDDTKIITEPHVRYETLIDTVQYGYPVARRILVELAQYVKAELGEECVLVTLETNVEPVYV